MKKNWIIGTRGSKLALRQTEMVIGQLASLYPGCAFHTKIIKTTGDTVWDKPLQSIGEKGLFVKEIEEDLSAGNIDLAVHSMKDLPGELAPGLAIGAVLKREDPRDAFISLTYRSFSELPEGARIGTNSLRRKSQILSRNRSIVVIPIRGNVDTRIKKIESLSLDGIILALAGVRRMGLESLVTEVFPLDTMVPPSGQGAIGVEVRDEEESLRLLQPLNDPVSRNETAIERMLQEMIGGGCSVPLGINAVITDDDLVLRAAYGDEEGVALARVSETGPVSEARQIALKVLVGLKAAGSPGA